MSTEDAVQKRINRQKKVFTNWVNFKLADRDDNILVTNLFEDLKDGHVLYALLEELSGQSLRSLGKMTNGKLRIQHVANMNIVFKYLEQTVRIVGIGPQDIVDGNETLVLGMLWSTIVFFMAKDLGGLDDMAGLKKKILRWCKKHTDAYDDVSVDNLTSSFQDGKPFLAILNNVNPGGSPYNPTDDPRENLRRAMSEAREKYGVPELLDPEDPDFWKDEKSMLPQLAEWMKRLPDDVADKEAVEDQGFDNWSGENLPKVADHLEDLCKIPSIPDDPEHVSDMDAAAEKVKEIMADAGMDNVDKEDGFVVGDKMVDENKPTVLIYANYGVSSPDDPAGGAWDGNPFEPIKDNTTMTAKIEDKAHLVAPIEAVKAIMDTMGPRSLPVNVKVVAGGVPPPTHAGYDPSDNTQRLKDYLNKNKDKLAADYVLVSEPDGSLLAPGAAAGMFSCRGFVSFDVTASTFDPAMPTEPFCSRFVGPCLDPAMALAKAVGKLRDATTGQIAVPALADFPMNADVRAALQPMASYSEDDLRSASGYLAGVNMAPVEGANLAEQLCLLGGVSVVTLGGTFGECEEATIPKVASVRVHANIPPEAGVTEMYEALTAHISAAVPFGVNVEYSNMRGEPGWISQPNNQFFRSVCASMGKEFAPRPATSGGNPEYKPIPSTFANVFGKPTYMHGVNDVSRNLGHVNENIKLEDVRREIRAFVKTLTGLAGLPLDGSVAMVAPISAAAAAAEEEKKE